MSRIYHSLRAQGVSPTYLSESREEFTMPSYLSPRKYDNISRYTLLRTLRDEKTRKLYHENWNKKYVTYNDDGDQYITVPLEYENRIDILAYNYYQNAKFWWVIALANQIIDPFDIPAGTVLRIPPFNALYDTGGVLSGS